ncbi:MAG: histidinol phosphatase [Bacteroidota bacterium]|nr:histidinol phosphatase [Bacteroidota bacterium]
MFNFFKKEVKTAGLYDFKNIRQDIHNHLLPGIDDGSPDIKTSIALIKQLKEAGFSKFICTPHIISDLYRNTPQTIESALANLEGACLVYDVDVQLSAAAEYMMDDYFMELLRKKTPLLTLTGNFVLTELSYAMAPSNLEKIAFELVTSNYQPIMAHPERYHYYHKKPEAYSRMKELGFKLQVNLLSLTGYYGKPAAQAARYLFEQGLVDFVGTDLHHQKHLDTLLADSSRKIFFEVLGDRVFNTFE